VKFISVPLSEGALERLDRDECIAGDLYELVLGDEQLDYLFSSGIIDLLNSALGKEIDVYEDDRIVGEQDVATALKLLRKFRETAGGKLLDDIIYGFELAKEKSTGVFFYL